MKMKKGQMQQIFTWMFVLILAVTILFFGIKTFRSGEDFKDEVLLVDFYKNLEKKINDFYFLDIKSSGREDFILPSGVTRVCFINLNVDISDPDANKQNYINSLNEFSNVFVFPQTEFKENRAKIGNFFVDDADDDANNVNWDGSVCPVISGGRLELRFINKGREGVQINDVP